MSEFHPRGFRKDFWKGKVKGAGKLSWKQVELTKWMPVASSGVNPEWQRHPKWSRIRQKVGCQGDRRLRADGRSSVGRGAAPSACAHRLAHGSPMGELGALGHRAAPHWPQNNLRTRSGGCEGTVGEKRAKDCCCVQDALQNSPVLRISRVPVKVTNNKKFRKKSNFCWGAFNSTKNHNRPRRKRQSITAKREKSQTPKFVQVRSS